VEKFDSVEVRADGAVGITYGCDCCAQEVALEPGQLYDALAQVMKDSAAKAEYYLDMAMMVANVGEARVLAVAKKWAVYTKVVADLKTAWETAPGEFTGDFAQEIDRIGEEIVIRAWDATYQFDTLDVGIVDIFRWE
jgi:hypothetical protein